MHHNIIKDKPHKQTFGFRGWRDPENTAKVSSMSLKLMPHEQPVILCTETCED